MDNSSSRIDDKDRKTQEKIVDDVIKQHFAETAAEVVAQRETEIDGRHSSDTDGEEEDQELPLPLTPDQLVEVRSQVISLKESGNTSFRKGDYPESISIYCRAITLCKHKELYPERAILYSNRAASEMKLNHAKAAIHSSSRAIKYNAEFPKAYLRRAKAYAIEDKLEESLEDYKKVLAFDQGSKDALEAIPDLEKRINERNEKMKAEMMDKLKDLGNLVLRPFGLSTSNFQMAQDPNTGGYSINFKQN